MGPTRRFDGGRALKRFKKNEARRLCAGVKAMGQLKSRARLDWRKKNCDVCDEALLFRERFGKFCLVKLCLLFLNRGWFCWTFLKSAYAMASQRISGKVIGNVRQVFGQGFES